MTPERRLRKQQRDRERYYETEPKLRWARTAVQTAKRRALKSAVVFGITVDDILAVAGDTCPALGIPLDYTRGRRVIRTDSPTIDRIIPELGYVPSNIAVISNKANCCKGVCGPAELMDVGRWLMRVLAGQPGGLCASTT